MLAEHLNKAESNWAMQNQVLYVHSGFRDVSGSKREEEA